MAKRPSQDEIELKGDGVERKKCAPVEKAAIKYKDIRDERMELTEAEVGAKAVLIQVMKDHSLITYHFDDQVVTLKPGKDNVKVKTAADGESDAEAEGDDTND